GGLPAVRVELLGFLFRDTARDDDVVAYVPIDGRRDLVLGGELDGIENAHDLVEVPAGAHGIGEHELDLLIGTDDENRADRRIGGGRPAFRSGSGIGGKHVVEFGDF